MDKMKKIKVAFCLRDMQMGGVESVLVRTLDELCKDKNFDVTVITFVDLTEPLYIDWLKKHKNIKHFVLYPCKYLTTRMPHFFLWRVVKHWARDVYRFICRNFCVAKKLCDFDTLVDFHDFGFQKEFNKVKNIKKIAWFHSSVNVFIKRGFINRVNDYDKVVVLTDDCVADLCDLYPVYAHKFIKLYNIIDCQKIKEMAKEDSLVDGDYFCCVSRMSGDKDIKTVIDAFDCFCGYHKDMKLVLVGDGDKLKEYKKYVSVLDAANKILFVGAQKNPYVYMAYAKANILSSYGEGFALVLAEAQVLGIPNISSNCKYGPREILLDGRAGLLFEPGDVSGLAKHMVDVYEDNVDVKNMVKTATSNLERFDKNKIIEKIKSLIS